MAFIEIPSHENVLFIIILVASYISIWPLVEQAARIKLPGEIATVFVFVTFMAGVLIISGSMPRTPVLEAQITRLQEIVILMLPYALFGAILTAITLCQLIGYLYKSVTTVRLS